ncbi:hypothetical protein M569_09698 [Genlisea aurea]|uniref:DYW domain-containing protein n=1 Tax=Genlisea aurea TaxID=192259 RepID=S8CDY5_9LAMI|nr:hypothetical protein M569_09698 [Genlisea aurea]
MSDVFEGYERRFRELSAELVRKTSSVGDLDGELKIQKITDIIAEMDEAEGMILKMDADARSLPPNVKAVLLAKLREYQSDLNDMKNKANLIASTNFHRDELMEAGMADSITLQVPENNGDRTHTTTAGGLNRSSDNPVEEELAVHELDANNRAAVSYSNFTIVVFGFMSGTPAYVSRRCRVLIRLCARHSALEAGKKLHAAVVTSGLITLPGAFLRNVILHMYAASGDLACARKVFDDIPVGLKDTVDWTRLIDCYNRYGWSSSLDGLSLFVDMRRQGVPMDEITIMAVLGICSKIGNPVFGIQGHACMIKMGLGLSSGLKAWNAAMDMYVKCGMLAEAKKLFDGFDGKDVVSWTVLLWGVLKWEGLEKGKKLFDEMPERNEIAWSILVSRYIENCFIREAFHLLQEMAAESTSFTSSSLCLLLSACTQSGDVSTGRWVHSFALRTTADASTDVRFSTALLDMYAKCGRINSAIRVFEAMPSKNVVTWNAMLGGLAMHGRGSVALDMFDSMADGGWKPDDVTFTALLSACSHSGLVDRGRELFRAVKSPSMENCAAAVDLLGRAGHLEEAEAVIRGMPMQPNEVVLGSLLGACRVHRKHHHLVESLVRDLFRMHPHNTDHHVLLANTFSSLGKFETADSFRKDLESRGTRKIPGISTMFVDGEVHQFSAGERSHSRIEDIYGMLERMIPRLKQAGYVPDVDSSSSSSRIHDADEDSKECALQTHGEKLALCFGLISTKPGSTLRIFKNLRICRDCHAAMKVASGVYGREIIVRDRNRFHTFEHGSCSCSDYW